MKFSQLSEEEDLGASGNQVVFRLLDAEVGGGGSRRKKISRFDFDVVSRVRTSTSSAPLEKLLRSFSFNLSTLP